MEWWKNPVTLIALASALVALASAAYAASSARTAKKAYRLTLKQDAQRKPLLIPYLSSAHILTSRTKIEVAISITVANPSDIDNSIAQAELVVEYSKGSNRTTTIRIPPDNHTSAFSLGSDSLLCIPKSIPSHQTIAGWLVFSIPDWVRQTYDIDSYSLSIYDSHQKITTLSNLLVLESYSNVREGEGHDHKEE